MDKVGGTSYFSGKFPYISLWSSVSIVSFSRKESPNLPLRWHYASCQSFESRRREWNWGWNYSFNLSSCFHCHTSHSLRVSCGFPSFYPLLLSVPFWESQLSALCNQLCFLHYLSNLQEIGGISCVLVPLLPLFFESLFNFYLSGIISQSSHPP